MASAAARHLERERPDAHGIAIEATAAIGLIDGFDDGTYRPHEDVTRSQAASLVVRTVDYLTGANDRSIHRPQGDVSVTARRLT